MLKRTGYILGGIIALWAVFVWFGNYAADDLARWIIDRRSRAFDAALTAEKERLRQMEMADTAGGATPEETVKMIIAALEEGDIERASTYYYVLDREKARTDFAKQRAENGNLDIALAFYRDLLKGKKTCSEMGCSIENEFTRTKDEYINLPGSKEPILLKAGTKGVSGLDFRMNQYTGVWKAEK